VGPYELNVLVVDDVDEVCHLLSKYLSILPVVVYKALDGIEALKIIERENIDLVLTDVQMPRMDGLELTKIIKKKFPKISVMMISCVEDFEVAKIALQNGVVDFISKPFRRDVIINRVKNVLKVILARKTQEKIVKTLLFSLELNICSIEDMTFEELFKCADIISSLIDLKLSKYRLKLDLGLDKRNPKRAN